MYISKKRHLENVHLCVECIITALTTVRLFIYKYLHVLAGHGKFSPHSQRTSDAPIIKVRVISQKKKKNNTKYHSNIFPERKIMF